MCVCGHVAGLHRDQEPDGYGCEAGAFTDETACRCTSFIDRGWAWAQIVKSKWGDTGPFPGRDDRPNMTGSEVLRKVLLDGEAFVARGRIFINNCAVANGDESHNCGMCDGGPCPVAGI